MDEPELHRETDRYEHRRHADGQFLCCYCRFGPDNRFRVLYDIDEEARVVKVMAIGEKRKERLFIGGEEVQL